MLDHVVTLDAHEMYYVAWNRWLGLLQEAKALEVLRFDILEAPKYMDVYPVTLGRLRSLELRVGDPMLLHAFLRDVTAPNLHNILIWMTLGHTQGGSIMGNILLSFVSSSHASPLHGIHIDLSIQLSRSPVVSELNVCGGWLFVEQIILHVLRAQSPLGSIPPLVRTRADRVGKRVSALFQYPRD